MRRVSAITRHLNAPARLPAFSTLSASRVHGDHTLRRIIRFVDTNGKTVFGQPIATDVTSAHIIEGCIYGEPKLTDKVAKIGKLLAPIEPTQLLCIGLNYKPHAKESKMAIPTNPLLFFKNLGAVTGPFDPIVIPKVTTNTVDYEVELAVVIGKACKNVSEEKALDYVLGYTVANDVSERGWQLEAKLGGGQWNRGKGFDTFCPLGPSLVLAPFVDPTNLTLTTVVNGKELQRGNTSEMIFSVRKLISFLSQDTTLLPGTVILTGTPEGIGWARSPQVLLKAGDRVDITISGIGTISNPVVNAP